MNVTLKAIENRNGVPCRTTLELAQQSDGTWHATKFGDTMQSAYNASKNRASQSRSYDTSESVTPVRTKLSDQEIADLAGKYDPNNMTQNQYDAFLDDLIGQGALSRFDAMRLGYHGFQVLDINPGSFATGAIGCGSAYVTSAGNDENGLIQSLEDADGDLFRWLESMLTQQDQGTREGSLQKKEALNTLLDIIKRM